MGAATFLTLEVGKYENAQEAFRNAVSEALYYEGRNGYTGTIAEKESFREIPFKPRKDPIEQAKKLLEDEEGFWNNKYGPAGCIEIKNIYLKRVKERSGLKGKKGIKAYIFFGWARK